MIEFIKLDTIRPPFEPHVASRLNELRAQGYKILSVSVKDGPIAGDLDVFVTVVKRDEE